MVCLQQGGEAYEEIQALLVILQLFFASLVSITIIAFALIIALVVIISKQK